MDSLARAAASVGRQCGAAGALPLVHPHDEDGGPVHSCSREEAPFTASAQHDEGARRLLAHTRGVEEAPLTAASPAMAAAPLEPL